MTSRYGHAGVVSDRQPEVLELIRAKYHTVLGDETTIRNLGANLISGSDRDLQLET